MLPQLHVWSICVCSNWVSKTFVPASLLSRRRAHIAHYFCIRVKSLVCLKAVSSVSHKSWNLKILPSKSKIAINESCVSTIPFISFDRRVSFGGIHLLCNSWAGPLVSVGYALCTKWPISGGRGYVSLHARPNKVSLQGVPSQSLVLGQPNFLVSLFSFFVSSFIYLFLIFHICLYFWKTRMPIFQNLIT